MTKGKVKENMKKIIFVLGIICLLNVTKVFAEAEKCQVDFKDVRLEYKDDGKFYYDQKEIAGTDDKTGAVVGT